MPWFKVDDDLAFHGKVVAAGNAAMGLWVRAGAWSAQTLTDGFIPKHMVAALGNTAQAKKLVAVGLWYPVVETGGQLRGYQFHQWADRQPTRAEVDEKRAAARERMKRARSKNKGDRSDDVRANITRTDAERSSEHEPPPEHDFDEISTESDRNLNGRSHSVTESFDGTEQANTQVDNESARNVRANFARSDANPVPTRPDPYKGGHLEGERYVGSGAAPENETPPPKFHAEHPDGWRDDCDDCDRVAEAWVAANRVDLRGAATSRPAGRPLDRCPKHRNEPRPPACGHCADARRAAEAWDAEHADRAKRARSESARSAAEVRAAAIANCDMCDELGYVGTALCDHDPDGADRARRGIALVRASLAEKSQPDTENP
ncbi:hypothetical protein [Nocardia sp. CA-290969]|uniref:hypothetical protein n=1 Tax=Nocardia sp. CA-290969 TaxID=3239986 RepID=UPI003D9224E1